MKTPTIQTESILITSIEHVVLTAEQNKKSGKALDFHSVLLHAPDITRYGETAFVECKCIVDIENIKGLEKIKPGVQFFAECTYHISLSRGMQIHTLKYLQDALAPGVQK